MMHKMFSLNLDCRQVSQNWDSEDKPSYAVWFYIVLQKHSKPFLKWPPLRGNICCCTTITRIFTDIFIICTFVSTTLSAYLRFPSSGITFTHYQLWVLNWWSEKIRKHFKLIRQVWLELCVLPSCFSSVLLQAVSSESRRTANQNQTPNTSFASPPFKGESGVFCLVIKCRHNSNQLLFMGCGVFLNVPFSCQGLQIMINNAIKAPFPLMYLKEVLGCTVW